MSHPRDSHLAAEPPDRERSFLRGLAEALATTGLFVVLGLLWAASLPAGAAAPRVYSPAVHESLPEMPPIWLVDGFNVVSVGLLGGRSREAWWSAANRDALLTRAAAFEDPEALLWVVFDGTRAPDSPSLGRVRQIFAESADDWLLGQVRLTPDPGRITVVTADRSLADRARHRGARVVAPFEFLERCPSPG